jgi:hypothetical protein
MKLPEYESGRTIVAEERWHGLLWSAVPQRVVSSTAEELITYLPAGTVGMYATNRLLPEAAGLTRDERKLLALKTCIAQAGENFEAPDKLHIYRPSRWARVNLGWDPSGAFMGWYVNFELPPEPAATGLVSKDLVLDIYVEPDRSWRWKDREDFHTAITEGILDASLREPLEVETEQVLVEIDHETGPFRPDLIDFRPRSDWRTPELPPEFAWGGSAWSLPPGPRVSGSA